MAPHTNRLHSCYFLLRSFKYCISNCIRANPQYFKGKSISTSHDGIVSVWLVMVKSACVCMLSVRYQFAIIRGQFIKLIFKYKGSFSNYVDKILPFDPPPLCEDRFCTLSVDKNRHSLPRLVHIVTGWTLMYFSSQTDAISRNLWISYWVLIYFLVYMKGGGRFTLKFGLSFHFQKFELNMEVYEVFFNTDY